jgi:hypothetical protein
VTRALAECCTAIGLVTPANGAARTRPQPCWKMLQLGERCTVLQMTAQALVNSLRSRVLRGGFPERQLLAALGRLTQQVIAHAWSSLILNPKPSVLRRQSHATVLHWALLGCPACSAGGPSRVSMRLTASTVGTWCCARSTTFDAVLGCEMRLYFD